MNSARYEGKPLLRLAEFYVLWSIGELSADDSARLDALAPKLLALYGAEGSWHDAVAAALKFPPDLPQAIVRMWDERKGVANLTGRPRPSPQAFAESFVDANGA